MPFFGTESLGSILGGSGAGVAGLAGAGGFGTYLGPVSLAMNVKSPVHRKERQGVFYWIITPCIYEKAGSQFCFDHT